MRFKNPQVLLKCKNLLEVRNLTTLECWHCICFVTDLNLLLLMADDLLYLIGNWFSNWILHVYCLIKQRHGRHEKRSSSWQTRLHPSAMGSLFWESFRCESGWWCILLSFDCIVNQRCCSVCVVISLLLYIIVMALIVFSSYQVCPKVM